MKVFAIIVTYNAMRRQWIKRCLDSLGQSSVPMIPVVIDNGSTDGTREYVPEHYPDVVWLPQSKNLGFGQANNIGILHALEQGADYVLLLNQDAALHPQALENMIRVGDDTSLVSPLQLNGDGKKLDEMFRFVLYETHNPYLLDDVLLNGTCSDTYVGGMYAAACWLMPVGLVKRIGGFNPLFFHYGEDYNYLNRLMYHGIKVLLAPHAHMYHDRNGHGDNKVFDKGRNRRDMLLVACDINKSFIGCVVEWMRILVRCYTVYLPKKAYKPGVFFGNLLWLAGHAVAVNRSRKKEKQVGGHWL